MTRDLSALRTSKPWPAKRRKPAASMIPTPTWGALRNPKSLTCSDRESETWSEASTATGVALPVIRTIARWASRMACQIKAIALSFLDSDNALSWKT